MDDKHPDEPWSGIPQFICGNCERDFTVQSSHNDSVRFCPYCGSNELSPNHKPHRPYPPRRPRRPWFLHPDEDRHLDDLR